MWKEKSIDIPNFQFLEKNRVNEISLALDQMKKRGFEVSKNTLNLLLLEEHKTQLSLESLGVSAETKPHHVPNINNLITPDIINKEKSLIIEVIGTPLTRKTTHIMGGVRYSQPTYYPIVETVKYAKTIHPKTNIINNFLIKSGLKGGVSFNNKNSDSSTDFETAKLVLNTYFVNNILEAINNNLMIDVPIVIDRWILDQKIFARSRFLTGRTSFNGYLPFYSENQQVDSIIKHVNKHYGYNYVVINCLNNYKSSIEMSKRQGDTINEESLRVTYQQYLRAHQEITSLQDRNFGYICLDLSSSDFLQNQAIFDETINKIYSCYL